MGGATRGTPAGSHRREGRGLPVWLFSWEEFILATSLALGVKIMPLRVYYYLYQGN